MSGRRVYAPTVNILLTNDDGIHAPGIRSLHRALTGQLPADALGTTEPLGEVTTVAPATAQSATSHGVTFHEPLMTRQTEINSGVGVAVEGRPADCVKLGLTNLWPAMHGRGSRPDLAISGMNAGANVGINVLYSGTIGAAVEAAFLGIPAIAVSMHLDYGPSDEAPSPTAERALSSEPPDFDRAAALARHVIDRLIAGGLPERHEIISINIPATQHWREPGDVPVTVCPMNTHALVARYEQRRAPNGATYYWAAGHGLDFVGADDGTDVTELFERRVTVTPLRYDMTNRDRMEAWRDRLS